MEVPRPRDTQTLVTRRYLFRSYKNNEWVSESGASSRYEYTSEYLEVGSAPKHVSTLR